LRIKQLLLEYVIFICQTQSFNLLERYRNFRLPEGNKFTWTRFYEGGLKLSQDVGEHEMHANVM